MKSKQKYKSNQYDKQRCQFKIKKKWVGWKSDNPSNYNTPVNKNVKIAALFGLKRKKRGGGVIEN